MDNEAVKKLKKNYKQTFDTESGKKVLADLAKFCNYNNTSVEEPINEFKTVFNEGKRRAYLRILFMIRDDNGLD